jgi:hypothetical protein
MTRWSRVLPLLAASLLLGLSVVELGLRAFGAFAPPPSTPVPRRPDLYRADPELGYTLVPSTRTTYRYPLNSTRDIALVSNADGFRSDREIDAPDPRRRLWMLGDSMVLGDGVDAADRLTEVIEQRAPGWRVDNLGMTGWGLDLMVRAFEKMSRRIRPDVLVLAFYTDDFRRLGPYYSGQGYPAPKFQLKDGVLSEAPFPAAPSFWSRLRLVQAVQQIVWRLTRNQYDLNAALLDRLRRDTGTDTALAVVFVPGRGDTSEDQERRAFLAAWCLRTQTPFLDLTTTIHGPDIDAAFIPGNPHWSEHGHRLAGEAIHKFLQAGALIR